jgi:hypothetical protein
MFWSPARSGPVGLLLYFIIRVAMRQQLEIHAADANV